MLWPPVAHAVPMAEFGPFNPCRMEMLPAALFSMRRGTVNGLILRGPDSCNFSMPCSMVEIPEDQAESIQTVGQAIEFIESKQNG